LRVLEAKLRAKFSNLFKTKYRKPESENVFIEKNVWKLLEGVLLKFLVVIHQTIKIGTVTVNSEIVWDSIMF